jgi:hypothetical protein
LPDLFFGDNSLQITDLKEKIAKTHHIWGLGFKKTPVFRKVSKTH